ncbi:MAG TPA: NAD-dependent epimerase/dehydratase family protein [Acidobacteriaceae bacterium]|nr:NAD-dependent epimerase/dehydratase family protein [Acidobacteriaceae bacterium]
MPGPLPIADLDLILEHTEELWSEMRGQRLFLTGGTGFFGCWLVESFCHVNRRLNLGAQATILSRDPAKFRAKCPHLANEAAITLHAGNVKNFEFPPGEFSHIIHAATETTAKPGAHHPLATLSTILAGTERALEFAMKCRARKFLLTSSGAVYGRQPAEMTHVPETYHGAPDPMDPASDYGEGKRAAEVMCALYQKSAAAKGVKFEAKIARCWAFCGPHLPLDAHFAIGNFIGDVIEGRPISIGGDGTPRRSYLYAADLAIWLWTILFRGPALIPINIGSAHDVSIGELAEAVAETLAPATAIHVAKQPVPGAHPSRYVPSVERAEAMLGLRPLVDLKEAIRRTYTWATTVE